MAYRNPKKVTQFLPKSYPANSLTDAIPYGIIITVKVISTYPNRKPFSIMSGFWLSIGRYTNILTVQKYINNDRAETSYISTVVYILVVVITLAVIMDVLAVIMTKQKLDTAADQITRQIQLSGKVDSDTTELLHYLSTDLGKATCADFDVDTDYITKEGCATAIQLGTPFYLTLTADVELGGFWELTGIPLTLQSKCAGVSERYWK